MFFIIIPPLETNACGNGFALIPSSEELCKSQQKFRAGARASVFNSTPHHAECKSANLGLGLWKQFPAGLGLFQLQAGFAAARFFCRNSQAGQFFQRRSDNRNLGRTVVTTIKYSDNSAVEVIVRTRGSPGNFQARLGSVPILPCRLRRRRCLRLRLAFCAVYVVHAFHERGHDCEDHNQ